MSNLSVASSLAPVYAATPAYIKRSAVPFSPRFPMPGGTTNGLTIGTNGTSTTYTPIRSALEAQAWGATVAVWSYTDRAASLGFASPAAFIAEFTAIGVPIQATTNSSAVSDAVGPFAKDIAGYDFSPSGASPRPAPLTGPNINRAATTISWAPANDAAGTKTPKLATITAQIAAGASMLHQDDPRGLAALCGFRGNLSGNDITSQAADFSATAIAGFPAWLSANTTSAQRTAVGLPSDPTGLDIKAWLDTNYNSIMHSPGQSNPLLVDGYLMRTSISANENLRTILLKWYAQYLRDDQYDYLQDVKTTAGVPLSCNLYAASPMDFMTWIGRKTPQVWDFAISEVPPPYWSQISGNTVGSAAWMLTRWAQTAAQHMQMMMADWCGLLCLCEHKPTAPNTAPARVVTQLMRQSIMQTVMEGHVPVVPADIFMTTGDARDQGVSVDGYRWWGSTANFGDLFAFIKAQASLIDSYEKLATVHVAVCNDSWPFSEGGSATRYDAMCARLGELWRRDVDYHFLPVGEAAGSLPEAPNRTRETTAPIIIRVQDDADYMSYLGRLAGPKFRRWSTAAADEAMGHSPVRSTNVNVRAMARYNAAAGRISVHLHNYAVNSDGTPLAQTTTLLWNWGGAGVATVTRLGESATTVDLSSGSAQVSLTEYAIVNFAVAA